MFNGTIITSTGRNVLAYCLANELPIQFTYMKIGDGVLSTETEDELTELISEKLAVLIEHKSCSNGIYMLSAVFTNQSLSQGFYIRECGLFVNNPQTNEDVLFAYDNAGPGSDVDYFSPGNGKVILKEVFEMAASIGNDTNVELVIDPKLVYVTEDEFEELKKEVSKKPEYVGEFTSGKTYKANNIFKYHNGVLLVNEDFKSGDAPDYSKVTILVPEHKYDHFSVEFDLNKDKNPTKENGAFIYTGGCERFTLQDWIDFIGYRPCIMYGQGQVETYLDPDNYAQDANGTAIDICDHGQLNRNVMIEFPRMGYKAYYNRSTSKGIIKITNDPDAQGYSYYAFNSGSKKLRRFFSGAYTGTIRDEKLYSLSGAECSCNGSLSEYREYANNMGYYYGLIDHYKMVYFQILYMVQNGTIDGKLSKGYSTTDKTTGELNTQGLNVFTVNEIRRKYLGMESTCFWETIDGCLLDNNLRLMLCNNDYFDDESYKSYEYCGKVYSSAVGYRGKGFSFDERTGFIATDVIKESNTYFKCNENVKSKNTIELQGGANIFETRFTWGQNYSGEGFSARLCFAN